MKKEARVDPFLKTSFQSRAKNRTLSWLQQSKNNRSQFSFRTTNRFCERPIRLISFQPQNWAGRHFWPVAVSRNWSEGKKVSEINYRFCFLGVDRFRPILNPSFKVALAFEGLERASFKIPTNILNQSVNLYNYCGPTPASFSFFSSFRTTNI